jgi:hypothetical protein
MTGLPYRQVHLDFHTSEAIPDVAAEFDADAFADTLAAAHVNSVTCFARCHHGWLYYDSRADPDRVHPSLARRDLLAEQITACHGRGIRVGVYTTVQWDHLTAERHADWCMLTEDGRIRGTPPYQPGFYRFLCVNTPYRQWVLDHVSDLFACLPAVDGLFLDIVQVQQCSCRYCKAGMRAAGLDASAAADRRRYAEDVIAAFKAEMTAHIRRLSPDCAIFYNAGHVGPFHRRTRDAYTHFELESLPSGGWGYVHFPTTMRYARTLGRECVGMTAKFHTSWGDFHSFKNAAALAFECFRMLALGARCCVGDQLHPRGRLCPHTYERIGRVYERVEAAEPWCRGAAALAEIAVLTPEEAAAVEGGTAPPSVAVTAAGVVRMLEEGHHQFDVVDSQADLAGYRLVILPDAIACDDALARKLTRYVAVGGALIASYRSGLGPAGEGFALEPLGVALKGEAPYSPDFIVPAGEVGRGLPATEHVMYLRAMEVEPRSGAEVLARVNVPYFNRTWEHFCSHQHTPSSGRAGYAGVVRRGRCVYFAHPVFTQYGRNAALWCKRMVLNAVELLLPQPLVRVDGPSTLLAALNEQAAERRWVLHLLHYIPERRGSTFDVVEDVIPLREVAVSVRADEPLAGVRCVPGGEELTWRAADGRIHFTVPEVRGHQMVELAFAEELC